MARCFGFSRRNNATFYHQKAITYKSEIKSEFDEIQNSLESFILQIVLDLGEELEWHLIPFSHIWNKLMIDLGISYADAFEPGCYKVNSSVLNRNVTKQAVGRILSSVLHGRYKLSRLPPDNKPERVWSFKRETVHRLMKARGIKFQEKLNEETEDLEE